jgi:hypothetical protein
MPRFEPNARLATAPVVPKPAVERAQADLRPGRARIGGQSTIFESALAGAAGAGTSGGRHSSAGHRHLRPG